MEREEILQENRLTVCRKIVRQFVAKSFGSLEENRSAVCREIVRQFVESSCFSDKARQTGFSS
jgi:hypothetical protein